MACNEMIQHVIDRIGDRLGDDELEGVDLEKIAEIVEAKAREGSHAFLWASTCGDVILWADEEESSEDDGANAIDRWQVNAATLAGLHNWID